MLPAKIPKWCSCFRSSHASIVSLTPFHTQDQNRRRGNVILLLNACGIPADHDKPEVQAPMFDVHTHTGHTHTFKVNSVAVSSRLTSSLDNEKLDKAVSNRLHQPMTTLSLRGSSEASSPQPPFAGFLAPLFSAIHSSKYRHRVNTASGSRAFDLPRALLPGKRGKDNQ